MSRCYLSLTLLEDWGEEEVDRDSNLTDSVSFLSFFFPPNLTDSERSLFIQTLEQW